MGRYFLAWFNDLDILVNCDNQKYKDLFGCIIVLDMAKGNSQNDELPLRMFNFEIL